MDQVFHLCHLKAVDDEVHHGLGGIGVAAPHLHAGHTALKGLTKLPADGVGLHGDDHGALGPVQAVHDEVHGLEGRGVRDDGIKGQDPVLQHDAADDVKQDVVCHDEGAHAHAQPLGEDDRHDLDTVHGAAEADGHTAADAGDDAAEQGAQQKVRPRQGRGKAHIHRQHVGDEPGSQGVDAHSVDGIESEERTLLFQSVQKQRHIQRQQKYRQCQPLRCHLGQKHGRAGDAAVIELDGGEENGHAHGVDDACRRQGKQIGQTKLFQLGHIYLFSRPAGGALRRAPPVRCTVDNSGPSGRSGRRGLPAR